MIAALLSRWHRALTLLFWLACAATMVSALMPTGPAMPAMVTDKQLHMLTFALLTLLGRIAYWRAGWMLLIIGLAVFGALIEFAQMIPLFHRQAEWADWFVDCIGIGLAASLCHLLSKFIGRRIETPLN